jgi:CRISPR/Cas system-associated exonuclease Cas4 (RecB family)
MGYPFNATPLYCQIEEFVSNNIKKASSTELIEQLIEFVAQKKSSHWDDNYMAEIAYEIELKLKAFLAALNTLGSDGISAIFMQKTLMSELRKLSLPFESDPINGLQIMGMLETRNLDFKHVLVLSASDDFLPNVSNYSSFIPHSIRKAFGLMSIEKRISVFAYYFYRLFHRSNSIDFVYNTTSTTTKCKEMSRFLQQIRIESGKEFEYINLPSKIDFSPINIVDFNKTLKHVEQILKKEYLSPSFLNTFLDCPLKFYFQNILKLQSSEEQTDDISPLAFGTLFHNSAKNIYDIETQDEKQIKESLSNIVAQQFEQMPPEERRNITQTHKDMIISYLFTLMEYNKKIKSRFLVAEKKVLKPLEIELNGKQMVVHLGGIIDRIDVENGNLVVIDYKTGGMPELFVDIDTIFEDKEDKRSGYIFQVLLYSWLLWDNADFKAEFKIDYANISPQILYIHKIKKQNYNAQIQNKSGESLIYNMEIHLLFEQKLREIVQKLLLLHDDFTYERNQNEKNCTFCDYSIFCN